MIAVFPLLASSGIMLAVSIGLTICSFYLCQAVYVVTSIFILSIVLTTSSWLQIGLENGEKASQTLVHINTSYALNAVIAISLALAYLCKIIILRKLYPRSKDQTAILIFGLIMSFLTLVCWCTSKFMKNSSILFVDKSFESRLVILPTFVYLLRISLSVMSACLVLIFIYSNRSVLNIIFHTENPNSTYIKHLILLFLSIVLTCVPIVIFILDLTNTYANLLSEMFNLTTDWASTIVVFFLFKDLNSWFKIRQSKGVLGRRQYNQSNSLNNLNLKRFNRFNLKLQNIKPKANIPVQTNDLNNQNDSVYVHQVARF